MERKLKNVVVNSVKQNIYEGSSELDPKNIDSGIKIDGFGTG